MQISVLSDALEPGYGADSRLFRIEFPDVEVKDERRGLLAHPLLDGVANEGVRQLSKVIAAGNRQGERAELPGRKRHLPDAPPGVFVAVDEPAEGLFGEFEAERTDTGVVCEAFLGQDIQRPEIILAERASRYTIPAHRSVRRALERVTGAAHVLTELLRGQIADRAVEVALAGDLMPTASDLGNHLGLMFADPSQDEECRLGADFIEKIEGKLGIAVHAAFETVPVIGGDDPTDRPDMTVVFQNNAQYVPAR